MFINLYIYSKNYNSIQNFINYASKAVVNKKLLNLNLYQINSSPKLVKILTALKSPHVNKTAQEHFEFICYTKHIKIYSIQALKFLFFFKSLKEKYFSDIVFKIQIINRPLKSELSFKNQINPDNFLLLNNNLNIKEYFKIINSYGILLLTQK